MKKSLRILTFLVCMAVLLGTLTSLMSLVSLADDDSSSSEEEDIWEKKRPAYQSTKFSSVRDRLKGEGDIDPMSLFAVNAGYAFYIDSLTGEVVILKLKDQSLGKAEIIESGEIPEYSAFYCTNPYGIGSAKAVGATSDSAVSEKEKLYAQIFIKYSEGDKDKEMNSFVDCAVSNQLTFKNIRGGIRVEYTIGREEVTYLVPRMIRVGKLEALSAQIRENSMNPRDADVFEAYYLLKDPDNPNITEKTKQDILNTYPVTKKFPIWVCEPGATTQELIRLERFVRSYTDYDYDTMESDHAETEYTSSDSVPPMFKLALEYRVDGDEIVIRCNAGNIRFDSSTYKLSDVLVLPYGGAGDANNSGYMLSPDGSGSLIRFSDLSSSFTSTTSLYGQDYAYHTVTGGNNEVARIPAFGVYQRVENDSTREEEQVKIDPETGEAVVDEEGNPVMEKVTVSVALEIAYLAVIEEGDSLAKININYGGPLHNYASIYTSFNPRPKDSYLLSGGLSAGSSAMWTVESKRKYTGDYKIRLFILDGTEDGDVAADGYDADKSYSDMAAAYRNYLINTGVLKENQYTGEGIPLYIETLGAIESTKRILGVPIKTTLALTSFEDTEKIISELSGQGIKNINIKMSGWYNGGMTPDIATSIKVEDELGGKEGFDHLLQYAKENGVTLFPDVELSFAYSDRWFDGFSSDDDLSQYIDDRPSMLQEYDPVTQSYTANRVGILSPYFVKKLYPQAAEDYNELNVGAISVASLGKYLSSDFNTDNPLTREDSKELITQVLTLIKADNERLLVNNGNEYTFAYSTDIINVSLDDSRYNYSYASVPFMSMVLHGSINYAGSALNLAGDFNYQFLKSVESGAYPYYVLAYENTSEIKTTMAQYYSIRYQIWKSDIVNNYNVLNKALKDVQSEYIVKHNVISNDGNVVNVTYSNGVKFYVNYGITEYEIEEAGLTVPAEGFIKVSASGEIEQTWEG